LALKLLPNLDFSRFELPGVLQRIALIFLACAFLFLYTNWRTQLIIGLGILVAYWLALTLIPVPGFGAGVIEPGKNLANWLDGALIPHSLLNKKGYDSEGLLSTFPAIASGISGLLAGKMLQQKADRKIIVLQIITAGILLILVGNAMDWFFPVIKQIWTSSYVLLTSGWAFTVFALIYWMVDIKGLKTGTRPWVIFGSNAIAIYVLADVFETLFIKSGLRGSSMNLMINQGVFIKTASMLWAIFSVLVCFLASYLLYKRRIFIKL